MNNIWVKRILKSMICMGVVAAVFGSGLLLGPELRAYNLRRRVAQFETWRKEDALRQYTTQAEISYQYLSQGVVFVGIYPHISKEVREILNYYFGSSPEVEYINASHSDYKAWKDKYD